jgi:PAS domain S-box-containing protein
VQISVRFQQMFGYSIEELRGKPPEFLIPPGHEHEFKLSNELLDRGGVHHLNALRLRRDGTLLEVQVSSQAIASGRFRGGLVVIYRDLTEANRHARHNDFRLKATSILAAATTVENAARELLPLMAELLEWDVVRLWQVGEDGLECVVGHSTSGFYCSADSEGVGAKCTIRAEEVARDGRSIWVTDFYPLASCNARAQCRLQDGWLAAFPLVDSQQQVLGVLELLAPHHTPESGQRELLESVCAQLGQFFTRCKAEHELAESEAKFRTLAETAPMAIFIHVDGVAPVPSRRCGGNAGSRKTQNTRREC